MGVNLFGEVVRRADLQSVLPTKMWANRGSSTQPSDMELNLDAECSSEFNEERTRMVVDYKFAVSETENSGFEAGATFQLVYSFDPALTPEHDDDVRRFAEHNGRFNSWPFLRQYLARVTSEFGMPPLTLPLLKPHAPGPSENE